MAFVKQMIKQFLKPINHDKRFCFVSRSCRCKGFAWNFSRQLFRWRPGDAQNPVNLEFLCFPPAAGWEEKPQKLGNKCQQQGGAIQPGISSRHWREAKKSNREEKEKFEILFSNLEKRKRTLKFLSPLSRREREICKKVLHFREEKENGIFYSQVSRGEREIFTKISNFEKRREIWNSFLKFREEKEKFAKRFSFFQEEIKKWIFFSQILRGGREFWKQIL